MNDFPTLLMRLEFAVGQLASWQSTELDVQAYEPADGGDGGVVTRAIDEGFLDELPGTVDGLLGLLDADEGWTVERADDAVVVHVNGLMGDGDPQLGAVRGAVASQLFAHAVETAGASGYLYFLDFYLEDELPTTARLSGRSGSVEREDFEDADPQERMELVDGLRERVRTSQALWSVSEDATWESKPL